MIVNQPNKSARFKSRRIGEDSRGVLLDRFGELAKKHPVAKNIAKSVGELFMQHANIPHAMEKVESHQSYGFLNDAGKVDALRKELTGAFKTRVGFHMQLQELASVLGQSAPKLKPRKDHGAVAELRDREIRDIVRGWPQEKRDKLASYGSPEIVRAVVEVPAEVIGVPPSVHNELREQMIEAEQPGAISSHKAAVEALTEAEAVGRMVDKDFAEAGGFLDHEYERHIKEAIAPEVTKPLPMEVHPVTGHSKATHDMIVPESYSDRAAEYKRLGWL